MKNKIKDKTSLHKVIDEMILTNPSPTEITLCESLAKYDKDFKTGNSYRGLQITVYQKWFAQGKILVQ